jgi:hypothetical protein
MIEHGRIIAVNYVPGAGGKFIQNCLALSRYCAVKSLKFCDTDYDLKLNFLINTIPPPDRMHNWLGYELRDDFFFGRIFSDADHITSADLPVHLHQAADQQLWVTYTAHSHGAGEHVEKYWPTVRYVSLVNADQFIADWAKRKNPNSSLIGPNRETPSGLGFEFDIDSCIYNKELFLTQVHELYEWLGWDDFHQAPIDQYYCAYIAVHSK